jgi:hypothetical protein
VWAFSIGGNLPASGRKTTDASSWFFVRGASLAAKAQATINEEQRTKHEERYAMNEERLTKN